MPKPSGLPLPGPPRVHSWRLTRQAELDLLELFLFGIERFGSRQAARYRDSLTACFSMLGNNPRMGRRAPSLGSTVRRHEHGSHVIIYEPDDEGVLILAVIHGRNVLRPEL